VVKMKEGPLGSAGMIREYFGQEPHGRKVTLEEMKAFSSEERLEIAKLIAADVGMTLQPDGKFV